LTQLKGAEACWSCG